MTEIRNFKHGVCNIKKMARNAALRKKEVIIILFLTEIRNFKHGVCNIKKMARNAALRKKEEKKEVIIILFIYLMFAH